MAFPTRVDTSALFNVLQIRNATAGWDFVVSYVIERLNPILAQDWAEGQVCNSKRGISLEDTPLDECIDFVVSIGSPSVRFKVEGTSVRAVLRMPLNGHYIARDTNSGRSNDDSDAIPIPDGVVIQCIIPQENIVGQFVTDAAIATKHLDNSQNNPFCFWTSAKKPSETAGTVILDFLNEHGTLWDVLETQEKSDTHGFFDDVALKLQAWLHSSPQVFVRCARTEEISSTTPVSQPKAFSLAATGAENNGILSMFVQSAGSQNGPGVSPAKLDPSSTFPACPLPIGKSTSTMINRWFFMSDFLAPALNEASSRTEKKAPEVIAIDTGFKYNIWPVKDDPDSLKSMWKNGKLLEGYTGKDYEEQLRLDNTAYIFELRDKRASVSYKAVDTRHSKYKNDVSLNVLIDNYGTVSPNGNVSFEELKFGGADFDISVRDPPWMSYCYTKQDPNGRRITMRNYPDFSLKLPALDFSTIHKLLGPSVHENLVMDKDAGFQCPYDIIMVGDLSPVAPADAPRK